MSRAPASRVGLGALVLLSTVLAPALSPAPAAADIAAACNEDDATSTSAVPGRPLESLRIPQVQEWFDERGRVAGEGVVVAVLDSGVLATPQIPLAGAQVLVAGRAGADFYQGTAVAGIIAGRPEVLPGTDPADGQRIGIAPGAAVLDVKIFDNDGTAGVEGDILPDAAAVSSGLDRVLELRATVPIKVVNLGVAIADDPGVKAKINQLWKQGVIVVSAAGDRPTNPIDPLGETFRQFRPGENAAGAVFPAGYDRVLAATTTVGGLPDAPAVTDFILQSSQIDVAVPTSGAASYNLGGASCSLRSPSSRWAAAEISGVLAALASAYPSDRPAQLVSRLLNTADGRTDVPTPLVGAGQAQPYEALTRQLSIAKDGSYDQTTPVKTQQKAEAPVPERDPLVSTRRDMVWFGLIGGVGLVLALVLRPVLARRRRTD